MEEVYPDIRKHVTPTARDIQLCVDGDGYFFKGKEEKQRFKLDPNNASLTRADYNRMQIESGNSLVEIIAKTAYRVDRNQQLLLQSQYEMRQEFHQEMQVQLEQMQEMKAQLVQMHKIQTDQQEQLREKDKIIADLHRQLLSQKDQFIQGQSQNFLKVLAENTKIINELKNSQK